MDPNKAWLVDFKTGHRCEALMRVQRAREKEDEEYEKAGGFAFPMARKWTATEYVEGMPGYDREDSPG